MAAYEREKKEKGQSHRANIPLLDISFPEAPALKKRINNR
jgi:hypothetical protein